MCQEHFLQASAAWRLDCAPQFTGTISPLPGVDVELGEGRGKVDAITADDHVFTVPP